MKHRIESTNAPQTLVIGMTQDKKNLSVPTQGIEPIAISISMPTQPTSLPMDAPTGPVTEQEMLALNQLFTMNQYDACMTMAKNMVTRDPACLGALITIARVAIPLKQYALAFGILLRRLKDDPNNSLTYYLLATAYKTLRQYDRSLVYAQNAIELEPNNIIFCEIMAKNNFDIGRYDQAYTYYNKVNAISKTAETSINLSLTMLASKHYREGWQLYENRFKLGLFSKEYIQSPMPFWDGKSDITDKKLLLIWEQGVGDVIQFMRFIPLLKQKTHAKICFVCGPHLVRLACQIHGIDMIHVTANLPAHDYKVYLLSLPLIFNIFEESQFLTEPYLYADHKLIEKWRHILPKTKPYKIGICWSGGGKYSYNLERNCSLGQFIKLLQNNTYQLISLQKELTPEDKELLSYAPILSLADALTDFSETAAVIANLDLVITVDTSIGHLAGAMGKPVWLLIRYETEWRHPRDCEISPWYPSMRLFRQAKPGDWDSVFEAVHKALATR